MHAASTINDHVTRLMRCVIACSGGLDIVTRVTRRSEAQQPPDRLDTSEYFEQARGALQDSIFCCKEVLQSHRVLQLILCSSCWQIPCMHVPRRCRRRLLYLQPCKDLPGGRAASF